MITFDSRGNGRADRPVGRPAYADTEIVADLLATLDATGTDAAVVVTLSHESQRSLGLAARHPDRVAGLVFIAPSVPLAERKRLGRSGSMSRSTPTRAGRSSTPGLARDYRDFLEFFFGRCSTEPHSTKQLEDAVAWGLETYAGNPDRTTIDGGSADGPCPARRVKCPTLLVHGTRTAFTGLAWLRAGPRRSPAHVLVAMEGTGHTPNARDPVAQPAGP